MRINKWLASMGVASRRAIDDLIQDGKVMVNGTPAELGMQIDPKNDEVTVDGEAVNTQDKPELEYWKLYKPVGVVSTVSDPEGRKTVLDLLKGSKEAQRLFPVGRLDIDSEGLLLMTNDGKLTQKLTHPKYEVPKEYLVWINGPITGTALRRLSSGVKLSDGKTAPATIKVIFREPNRSKLSMIISEGRTHQIRRMVAKVGATVVRLKRTKLGTLELGEMEPGEVKQLTLEEVEGLKQLAESSA